MVVWKNYTLPLPFAYKSAKYMNRIVGNSFISDLVSPAVRELLSSSSDFLFLKVLCQSGDSLKPKRMKLNKDPNTRVQTESYVRRRHHGARL